MGADTGTLYGKNEELKWYKNSLMPSPKKIVKQNDWNQYYIKVKGRHIEAWLNGLKRIDIIHDAGFSTGNIGFRLCYYHNATTVDIKSLYIREVK